MHIVVIASFDQSLLNFRGELLRTLRQAGHRVTTMAPFEDAGVQSQLRAMGIGTVNFPLQRTGMNPLADLAKIRVKIAENLAT